MSCQTNINRAAEGALSEAGISRGAALAAGAGTAELPAPRQAWQTPKAEWLAAGGAAQGLSPQQAQTRYYSMVERAASRGEAVPPAILDDYLAHQLGLGHTPHCVAAERARFARAAAARAWYARWPDHCGRCRSTGIIDLSDPSVGVYEEDRCPRCAGQGLCPRCGQTGLPTVAVGEGDGAYDDYGGPCAHCHFAFGANADDCPPECDPEPCDCLHMAATLADELDPGYLASLDIDADVAFFEEQERRARRSWERG